MEEDLLFVIDDVFNISNVGTVVTAKIFNEIKVGDKIIIASEELTAIGSIWAIEKFIEGKPQKFEFASNNENVGVYIDYPKDFSVRRGMLVLKTSN